MNALLDRYHNFMLPLIRGEDHVCACTCGRHQAYHVIPYHGGNTMWYSKENYCLSDNMSQQEMGVLTGLLLGLCLSWFLCWLDGGSRLGLKNWRASRLNDVGFWSRIFKFSSTKDLYQWLHPKHRGLQEEHGANQASGVP